MKKIYVKPTQKSVAVKPSNIICGSRTVTSVATNLEADALEISETGASGDVQARSRSFGDWDD